MMMMWNKLSVREQSLIVGAGILLVLLVFALAVVRPLIGYQAEGEQSLLAAQSDYRAIAELSAAKRSTGYAQQAQIRSSDQSARIIISTSARDMGVVVSRIQPAENGSLTLWMDSVSSAAFYEWLKSLETKHGITPELVSLQKNSGGLLRAQVQFKGTQ